MKLSSSAVFGILFLCTVTVYFFAALCGFVYDDGYLLVQNPFIRDLKFLPQMFAMDVTEMTPYQAASGYYRPVSMAVLTLLFQIFQLKAFLWHLFNLMIHTAASFFIYQIIRRLGIECSAALFGAALFAVHPVHVEAVVPIYNYMGILAACFALFSCWSWMEYRITSQTRWGMAALACYALGVFSKEDILVLPAVFFFYDLLYTQTSRRKKILDLLPFAAAAVIYVAMRLLFVERGAALGLWAIENKFNLAPAQNAAEKILMVLQVYSSYLRMLIWPGDLTAFHVLPKLTGTGILTAFAVILAAAAGLFFGRRTKIILFSAAWFFITTFLVSNIIPIGGLFAERLMYLPSAAFCFFGAWLFAKAGETRVPRAAVLGFTVLILAAYSVRTWAYVPVWQDDVTLWSYSARKTPGKALVHLNLAEAYFVRGRFTDAVPEYRRVLSLPHNTAKDAAILQKLGRSLGESREYAPALQEFRRAKALIPSLTGIDFDIGWTCIMLKDYAGAEDAFKTGLKTDPENAWFYFGLGETARLRGSRDQAIDYFREALKRNQAPQFAEMIGAKLKELPVPQNA